MPKRTSYRMLRDKGAVAATERLRRTYRLADHAAVYDLGVRLLSWIADSQAKGWEAPARNKAGEGVQVVELPAPLNKKEWLAHASP